MQALLEGGPFDGQVIEAPVGAQVENVELRAVGDGLVHRYFPNPLRPGVLMWLVRHSP